MGATTGLVIFAGLCIAGSLAVEWTNLRVSFGRYHEIPLTLDGLLQTNNYSLMVRDDDLNLDFYCFKNDPRVSVGVDSYGNIGGLRVSFIKSDLPALANANNLSFPAYYEDKPFYSSGTFLDTDVYYTDVLFAHPDTLRAGGRCETGGLLGEDVYLKLNGEWDAMPKNECDATSQGYILESCFVVMGLHYFYDMRSDIDCVDLQPVFGLYENGEMIGMGVSTLGMQTVGADRTWLENTPKDILSTIVSNRPDCLIPYVESYGITSLHFFFKKDYTSTPACVESVCQS